MITKKLEQVNGWIVFYVRGDGYHEENVYFADEGKAWEFINRHKGFDFGSRSEKPLQAVFPKTKLQYPFRTHW